jgi:2,3-dihydro-2,3-dihydroxybenzoate dehydrogenase
MFTAHLGATSVGAVLVSGAASGIGRATALRLARGGAAVGLLDRDVAGLTLTAEHAREAGASGVVQAPADVASRAEVDAAFATVVDALGPLDGLVCAAGILLPGGLQDTTTADWDRQLATNSTGALHCLQAGATRLRDGGAIVVVSSNAARVPRTGMLAYAASKAATSALARCAGLELAERGLRCNVVEPGSTDTAMQRALWPDPDAGATLAVGGDPAAYRVGIPLGRIADPDDVAAMACFLISPDARHVTLQQIYVDGGASL